MDLMSSFAIKKHTNLLHHFPSIAPFQLSDCSDGAWLLFGSYISQAQFFQLSQLQSKPLVPLASWSVGPYDVFLLQGTLTPQLQACCDGLLLDCAAAENIPSLNDPGLALFDMDSTAIEMECIDEIAFLAGFGEEVISMTARAMCGELDFEQSLRQRVALLKGTDASVLMQVREKLTYTPGMRQLTASLQAYGWKVAIASGGFTWFSDYVKEDLNLDFAQANQLVIEHGKLTGELTGIIVDAQRKADILRQLAGKYGIAMGNTVAVGDGANDLPMMAAAGLGVAYHAKPAVQKAASVALLHTHLGGVLCVLSASLFLDGDLDDA